MDSLAARVEALLLEVKEARAAAAMAAATAERAIARIQVLEAIVETAEKALPAKHVARDMIAAYRATLPS